MLAPDFFTAHCTATRLDVHEKQIYRWRSGGIPRYTADRLACHLNLHPAIVWPDWWAKDIET